MLWLRQTSTEYTILTERGIFGGVILSNMKLCNAVSCPAHEVKLNLTSLSWENVCVMYLNNNG